MNRVLLFLILSIFLFNSCNEESNNEPQAYRFSFQFITENYKPLNYQEDGEIKGLAPDLLRQVCSGLNIPFEVSLMDWEQGYNAALNNKNAVLFSTVLNSTRKDLFKWAGPFASMDWSFYAASPASITLNSLEEAKTVQKIGVMKDYAITQYLEQQGFTNLVYVNNNIEGFDKLLKNEIDLFPSDNITTEAALITLDRTIWDVTPLITILTDLVYFAFNKEIPDDVVADFQGEINKQRNNGTLLQLYQKYLKSNNPPDELILYTEQYPPITFRNNFGEITGYGTDIVKEIMKRNNRMYPITLSLWSNGYAMVQNIPNFCLFTMDKTPIRESLFQWVGPIGSNKTYFFVKSGSGISISSIDEAKNLARVGTVSSWFSDQYLRNLGFTNLISEPDPAVMVQKLINGDVDAFVCTNITLPEIMKSAGYQYSQVTPAFELMSTDFYIAFSKNTSAQVVAQWQSRIDEIKQDGTYDAINRKWFSF